MVVNTSSEKVRAARRTLLELLMADHPSPVRAAAAFRRLRARNAARDSKSITAAALLERATARAAKDDSSMTIAVDFDACILCDRCIRGCSEIRENFVLGRMGKGSEAAHRLRRQPADGRFVLRFLRRVHGLLPHRAR